MHIKNLTIDSKQHKINPTIPTRNCSIIKHILTCTHITNSIRRWSYEHTDHISRITHVHANAHTRTRAHVRNAGSIGKHNQTRPYVHTLSGLVHRRGRGALKYVHVTSSRAPQFVIHLSACSCVLVSVCVCVLMYLLVSYTYPQYRYTEFEALTHTPRLSCATLRGRPRDSFHITNNARVSIQTPLQRPRRVYTHTDTYAYSRIGCVCTSSLPVHTQHTYTHT